MLCAGATALLIAPAAFHRMIYRRRLKQHLVRVANRLAITGLVLLLLSMVSAVLLIIDVVLGLVPAFILAAIVLAWFTMWWFVLPLRIRVLDPAADDRSPDVASADASPAWKTPQRVAAEADTRSRRGQEP
jgi:hypothetical protein